VEAMGAGNLVLAYRTPENAEVLAGTGLLFDGTADLRALMTRVVRDPHASDLDSLRRAARARAEATYSWDAVVTSYEALFRRLARARGPG
jgi:glycosyltransferase involved in cell wall biosynthesis